MTSAPLRLSRVSTAIAIVFLFAAAPAAAAGYLKLGDIKPVLSKVEGGQASATEGVGGRIEIESWSWGASNAGSHGAGGGGGAGKVSVHDISMSSGVSRDGIKGGGTVEREMKESGEKGGTEDINIGVGELQEATISKSMDSASPKLARPATIGSTRNGSAARGSLSVKVPAGTCKAGARYPTAELGGGQRIYRMTGVVVTGCTAAQSGDGSIPTETLSLNFDKISWKYWP